MSEQAKPAIVFVHGLWADGSCYYNFSAKDQLDSFDRRRLWRRSNIVDFSGANLSGKNLTYVDLTDVDLSNAKLSRANLSGANLLTATGLTQTLLNLACGRGDTKLPSGIAIKPCPGD